MNKFYKVNLSTDENIIGRFPQSIEMNKLGDFGLDSNINLGYDGPIDSLSVSPETILQDEAFLTNIVDSAYLRPQYFLIIDKLTLSTFEKYNIPNYEVFKSPVIHKGIKHDYNLFHLSYPADDKYIDFKQSEFYTAYLWESYNENLDEINSYKDFLDKRSFAKKEKKQVKFKSMVFNLNNCQDDIFRITIGQFKGYYVSENIKSAIEEKNLTGFEFIEIL